MLIHEISENEKPREKLQNYGIEALSSSELVALIIETGTKNESVLTIANRIINVNSKTWAKCNMLL